MNESLTTTVLNANNTGSNVTTFDGQGGYFTGGTPFATGFGRVNVNALPNNPTTSTIDNLQLLNTSLTFGSGAAANFSGTLILQGTSDSNNHAIVTGSSNSLTTFNGINISGVSGTVSDGTLIETGGGMLFTGANGPNSITGTTLQGNIGVQNGSTGFTYTTLQGVLTASSNDALSFNDGTMSQLTGAPAPGFVRAALAASTFSTLPRPPAP